MLYVAAIGARKIIKKKYIVLWTSCLYWAKASVHSTLYWRYKHLVLALQAPCTGTTSILYWHYKASCTDTTSIL